jgi:transposase-like protein
MKTPGSYNLASIARKRKKKHKKDKEKKERKKRKVTVKTKVGRPSLATKKRKVTTYRSRYTPEDMQEAVDLVKNEGYSVARAAVACNVPRITLLDRLKGNHKTGMSGRPTVLSEVEEDVLVEILVLMGEYNYPLTKRHLSDMVKNYLDKHRDTRTGFFPTPYRTILYRTVPMPYLFPKVIVPVFLL